MIWSLIAVPTMTILVSDLGDTVVYKFHRWSDKLADFTVLPKYGIWRTFLDKHPSLMQVVEWLQEKIAERKTRKRVERGFELDDPDRPVENPSWHASDRDISAAEAQLDQSPTEPDTLTVSTLPTLVEEAEEDVLGKNPSPKVLAHQLALSVKRVASDMCVPTLISSPLFPMIDKPLQAPSQAETLYLRRMGLFRPPDPPDGQENRIPRRRERGRRGGACGVGLDRA